MMNVSKKLTEKNEKKIKNTERRNRMNKKTELQQVIQ